MQRSAVSFRDKAEELRTISEDFADPGTRQMMARLASDYDRMAEELGRVAPPPEQARIAPLFGQPADATRATAVEALKRRLLASEEGEKAKREHVLRDSEARHRPLIESWAQAVWETDGDGVVVTDSPSWRAYTGQTLDEWLGYGWLDAIHPDDRAYAERQWREAMAARRIVDAEFRLRAPGGGWRWTNVRTAPVLDADGTIEKWAGMNIDIDARKRAEAELRESEERQAYFLALSDALRPLADQEEIQAEAMRLLGEKLGVNRAQYYIADETGEYLSSSGGYSNGIPAAIGRFHLIEFGKYAFDGFHAGETQVVSDARTDPRISEDVLRSYETVGFMAYIGVPFVQRGRLVGTLAVHQSDPRQWTVSERMMVEETAERAGIAVEQARAESALRQSQERQAVLLKLTDALRPLSEAEAIIAQATQILGDYLKADRTFVAEMEPDGINMQVYDEYLLNGAPSVIGHHNFDLFGPFVSPILARGDILAVDDIAELTNLTETERAHYAAIGIAAYLLVPLVRNGRFAAVFAINHRTGRPWSQADKDMARQTADRTWTTVERARAETALRESEARFQQFAGASAAGMWIRDANTLAMEYVSPAIAGVYGVEPDAFLGEMKAWASLILPEDRDIALEHIERARQGEAVVHEFRIQRPDDGTFRWIRNTDFPLFDDQGRVQRVGGLAEDITEAKLSVEHQGVLLAELQHRVRNIMAIIRSIAARSGERATSAAEYAEVLAGRLLALSRVQALLTRAANANVSLRSIVTDEVSVQAHHEGQYEIDGPDVEISPKAAEVLTLAIHELATNALKYGALSAPDGKVTVRWTIGEKRGGSWLSLDWNEEGAPQRPEPTPDKPCRQGFGSELIEGRIPYELRGRGTLVIAPGGAQCHLEFPLKAGASILETGAPMRATVLGGALDMTGEADLHGRRVLVVEDDYYLATDAARALRGAGAEVLGPCSTEEDARAELAEQRPDAVLVDINLGPGPTFKLAETLKDDGIRSYSSRDMIETSFRMSSPISNAWKSRFSFAGSSARSPRS